MGSSNGGSDGSGNNNSNNDDNRVDPSNIQRYSHQLEITGSFCSSAGSNPPSNTATPRLQQQQNEPLVLSSASSPAPVYPSSIPYTPNADEARVFRYYCPLCMLYFRNILKMKCCGNYTCQQCAIDYLNARGVAVPSSDDSNGADLIVPISNTAPCPHCQISGFIPLQVTFEEAVRDYSSRSNAVSHSQLRSEPLHSPLRVGESFEDLKRKMIPYQSIAITTVLTSAPAAHGFQNPNSFTTPRSAYDDVIIVDSAAHSPQQSFRTPEPSHNGSGSRTPVDDDRMRSSFNNTGPFNSSGQIEVMGIAMLSSEGASPAAGTDAAAGDEVCSIEALAQPQDKESEESRIIPVTRIVGTEAGRQQQQQHSSGMHEDKLLEAGNTAALIGAEVICEVDIAEAKLDTMSLHTMDMELSMDSTGSPLASDAMERLRLRQPGSSTSSAADRKVDAIGSANSPNQEKASGDAALVGALNRVSSYHNSNDVAHHAEPKEHIIVPHTNYATDFVNVVMQTAMDKSIPLQ